MSNVQNKTFSIIEFTSLPQNLRTVEMRKKFDADNSGFLEANNSKGQNEIYQLEQAMGLDLSKYKKEASKVAICAGYNGTEQSIMYDKNGKPSVYLSEYNEENNLWGRVARIEKKGNVVTQRTYDKNFNIEPETNGHSYTTTHNATFQGINGLEKKELKNADGSTTIWYTKDKEVASEYTAPTGPNYVDIYMDKAPNGEITYFEKKTLDTKHKSEYGYPMIKYEKMGSSQLFANDKSKLVRKYYENGYQNEINSLDHTILKSREEYFLNGKPVHVQMAENGRYAVTHDGKTEYYSHDGKKLRMDYVKADTKNLEYGYKKKVSVNGETSWYYDPQGKQISKADYHSKVVKEIKVKNGKFNFHGKELQTKRNSDGSYNVTLGEEVFTLKIKVAKKK